MKTWFNFWEWSRPIQIMVMDSISDLDHSVGNIFPLIKLMRWRNDEVLLVTWITICILNVNWSEWGVHCARSCCEFVSCMSSTIDAVSSMSYTETANQPDWTLVLLSGLCPVVFVGVASVLLWSIQWETFARLPLEDLTRTNMSYSDRLWRIEFCEQNKWLLQTKQNFIDVLNLNCY